MEDYAGRILAERYRLPLPPSDEYELVETRAFDTRSGQEVLVRQVPLPEVVDAELLDGSRGPAAGPVAGRRPAGELPAVRRAIAAAQAAASVPDHPRLDQVFDVFAEGGSLWIVSELVPARPLAALVADEPLSPYRAAEVASDVLTALRVLHAHGWTHRNITMRTVLICEDGRVVLTGLAAGAAEEALCGYDPVPDASGGGAGWGGYAGATPPRGPGPDGFPGAATELLPAQAGPGPDGPAAAPAARAPADTGDSGPAAPAPAVPVAPELPPAQLRGPGPDAVPGAAAVQWPGAGSDGRGGGAAGQQRGLGSDGVPGAAAGEWLGVGPDAVPGAAAVQWPGAGPDGRGGGAAGQQRPDGNAGAGDGPGVGSGEFPGAGAEAGLAVRGPEAGAPGYAPLVAPGYDTGPRYDDHITPGSGESRPDLKAAARAGAIAAYRAGAQAAARVAEQRKAGPGSGPAPELEQRPEGSNLPQGYSYPYGGPGAGAGASWHGATPRRQQPPEPPQNPPPAAIAAPAGTPSPPPSPTAPTAVPGRPALPAQLALPQGYHQADPPPPAAGSALDALGQTPQVRPAPSGPEGPGQSPSGAGYGSPQAGAPAGAQPTAGYAYLDTAGTEPGPGQPRPAAGYAYPQVGAAPSGPEGPGQSYPAAGYGHPQPGPAPSGTEPGPGYGYPHVGAAPVGGPPGGRAAGVGQPGPQGGGAAGGGPRSGLDAERARQTRMAVVGAVTERWAPEQAGPVHGHWQLAAPVGPATDLWALGALLYRAVQGHAPYPEDSVAELVEMVCAEPPAFAEECGPLRPVVESLLRQDPTERPDFEELRGWLRSLVRSAPEPDGAGLGFGVLPMPEPDPARLPVVRRRGDLHGRHRNPAAPRRPRSLGRSLLVGILALLAGAVAYAMFFMPRAADQQDRQDTASKQPVQQQTPQTPQTRQPAKSPAPSASPPESRPAPQTNAPAPPGYTTQQDAEHFEIVVPNGWERRGVNESGQVRYTDGDFALTVVPGRDKVEGANPDPATYQKDKEPELGPYRSSTWSSVSDIRSTKVGNQLRVTGRYTWIDGNGRSVVARNFVVALGGSYHIVLVTGPQDQEGKVTEVFEKATASYKSGG
ncbi:hypothetical protein ACFWBF_16160 [Streptomyces sp. NPDC060028]|uniref:hypothetical protein n=1 Tax=Streptomyces sp. NPDC060028 TaxID=3347041 RepID=UPI0036A2B2F3